MAQGEKKKKKQNRERDKARKEKTNPFRKGSLRAQTPQFKFKEREKVKICRYQTAFNAPAPGKSGVSGSVEEEGRKGYGKTSTRNHPAGSGKKKSMKQNTEQERGKGKSAPRQGKVKTVKGKYFRARNGPTGGGVTAQQKSQ